MLIEQLQPQALADYLLTVWARWEPETLSLEPTPDGPHVLSIDLPDRALLHVQVEGALADAVIARLALVFSIDFTSSDERMRSGRVRSRGKDLSLNVSIRPAHGHLSAYLRKPFVEAVAITDDEVGQVPTMIGEYRILGEMGRGGLGIVYRAEHRLLQKAAAIKLLTANARLALSNAALVREARAAAHTRHPGVVEIYDVVKLNDGRFALIMELIEGEALSARMHRVGPCAPPEALSLVRLIAQIMQAMHAAGIVHRDLKPENVFLVANGAIKILDFGAARVVSSDGGTVPDSTFGTPWYMAPEQAAGYAVDRRSDVYSLGCILFELLTGDLPFSGTDPGAVAQMHITNDVPVATSPFGPMPVAIETMLKRALAKRPEARQQDMTELLRELEQAMVILARSGWRKWLTH